MKIRCVVEHITYQNPENVLQRNLIYAGITRAKRICVLIGSTKALGIAVRNFSVNKRNTGLKERLKERLKASDVSCIPQKVLFL